MESGQTMNKATVLHQKRSPASYLNEIIEYYVFRHIHVKEGAALIKYMPCRHSNSIDFYIGDRYDAIDLKSGAYTPFVRSTIRGPRTYKKYQIRLRGDFVSFSIRFKPAGIYQILGIPMNNFCDEAVDALLVRPDLFRKLTERLMGCRDIHSCIAVAETCLFNLATKHIHQTPISSRLATLLLKSDNASPVSPFYKKLPLTIRQLERNFVKEIGVSPKTYSRMVRFEKMIDHRIKQPQRKWTELAYEHNYFDQMHLIKDFHKFLDINPGDFSYDDFAF